MVNIVQNFVLFILFVDLPNLTEVALTVMIMRAGFAVRPLSHVIILLCIAIKNVFLYRFENVAITL